MKEEYKCKACDIEFDSEEEMEKHKKEHHSM